LAVVAETCAVCNVRTAGAFIINTSSSDLLFRLRRLLYSLANESELWRFDSVVEPLPAFFDGLRGRLATLTAFGTAGAAVVGNAEFCTMFLEDRLALTPSASDAAEATVIGIGEWNELRLVLASSASDTVKAAVIGIGESRESFEFARCVCFGGEGFFWGCCCYSCSVSEVHMFNDSSASENPKGLVIRAEAPSSFRSESSSSRSSRSSNISSMVAGSWRLNLGSRVGRWISRSVGVCK
jgi:hypothetical protein